ncbi:PH domain-containing protein [Candidatus Microgenomates bacterium]|nr:PH domain-containing protein [Candidatus Microgenomates bacterium]
MSSKKVRPASDKQKKKYAEYLAEGEEIVAAFGIGNRYFWFNAIPLAILSIPVIGLPFFLKLVHLRHSKTYLLTDRRVLIKDGVFSIKITTAPYDKITHITVREDFFKKISYGIGDITIHTAGPTPVEIDLIKVQNPMRVKNLIEELMVKERSLLGTITKDPLVKPL